jgi:hypothetical protein
MKLLLLSLILILLATGCQESSSKKGAYLMNSNGVNPNSLANMANDKVQDRANKVELSKIDADAKIQIAKIQSDNQLLIAKINADATKEVAVTDSTTKIKTTQIDAITKKEDTQTTFYIAIAVVIVVLIALYLLYLNNKNSRALKAKLHEDKLKQELLLKEKEYHEQRLHKMLDLVADGKLSPKMEEEIINSISGQKIKTISNKV